MYSTNRLAYGLRRPSVGILRRCLKVGGVETDRAGKTRREVKGEELLAISHVHAMVCVVQDDRPQGLP